jgi:hypothetical protein
MILARWLAGNGKDCRRGVRRQPDMRVAGYVWAMNAVDVEQMKIRLEDGTAVSALAVAPEAPRAAYVLAHGAGAGMTHPFLANVAVRLAEHGVATLRYQFPYMERGSRRPDSPRVAHAAVRAAVDVARQNWPDLLLFAGGKSFGGRMASQAQATTPLPGVRGLVFLGFPLHAAKRPSRERAAHLSAVRVPMLFVQGARDALAEHDLITQVVTELGGRATLKVWPDADHSFHVPVRSGRTDADVLAEICADVATWMMTTLRA